MRRTPMPPRSVPLLRTAALAPGPPLARNSQLQRSPLFLVSGGGAPVLAPPQWQRRRRKDTIPAGVRRLVHARDGYLCVHCGGYFPDAMELHHRRGKGVGGDLREHTDCACNLVSLHGGPQGCHRWAHVLNRPEAEAEGLIIPRATVYPFLLPVLVHGEFDGSGQRAWPTCDGNWDIDGPEGAVA